MFLQRLFCKKKIFITILMTASIIGNNAVAQQDKGLTYPPAPPAAKQVPHLRDIHGEKMGDPFYWLINKSNPEVAAYLESENAYTDAILAPTSTLQQKLYKELVGHIKETDDSAPYKEDEHLYYTRTEAGKQYPIYCRRKDTANAPEEIVLDQNELAKGEKFMGIGAYRPSDDGNWLAYSTDNTGFRQYVLYVKDLRSGQVSTEAIPKTGSIVWANDNKTLFYSVEDAAKRHYRIYRHLVGEDAAKDALVYQEADESFSVSVGKSRSGKYLFLEIGSHTTSEIRYMDAAHPTGEFKLFAPRIHEQEYYVDHRGDKFYIRTNRNGRTYEIASTPLNDTRRENWKVVAPVRPEVMLEDMELFKDYIVMVEREKGLIQLRVHDFRKDGDSYTGKETLAKFPEPTYDAFASQNHIWETSQLRYNYFSPITPNSVYEYDMEKHQSKLLKQQEVPGGFDRNNYLLERVYATARDGVKVPVTVFYRKGLKKDGSAPMYLYSYGSYGYPVPVNFSSNRLALLDRGIVIALAHIRGGGDLGKTWHDQGRMMKKMNTFNDFIDSADFLIIEKYCDPKRIAIEGGSAGGLLMGAVTNMRPELWKAVIAKVPFVDVLNTMLDESLPLTVGEFEEWGNPKKKEEYQYMRQYSPYDNMQAKPYPNMLVKTSFNDSQVMYHEPAKYVAKMRTLKPKDDHNVVLLKTNMAAGHGGASGRYDYLHEISLDYAFLLTQLGVERTGGAETAK